MDSSSPNASPANDPRLLHGLDPADLLCQGAADDTAVAGERPAFTPPSLEKLAVIFPQFEILALLGQGGMGAVYQVRQKALDRVVALKTLPREISTDPAFAGQFAREARALAQLNHPGIVTLYEFGQTEGLYFFLMEYVDGVTLRRLLERGRLATREALAIVPQICDALQYAHDHGIVHRDIKPENILLDRQGRVKVADFGLAKLVGARNDPTAPTTPTGGAHETLVLEGGKVLGTPAYMAPEQKTTPREVDHRADIYALGVVFYQMLTGELPGQPLEVPSRKVTLDVRLDEVVLRALERQPELRFQQASVLKTQVETIGATTAPPTPPVPRRKFPWWGWLLLGLAGVGILLFAALIGFFWFLSAVRTEAIAQEESTANLVRMTTSSASTSMPQVSLPADEVYAALQWLRLIDTGKYAESYAALAETARQQMPDKAQWIKSLTETRQPLGRAEFRHVKSGPTRMPLPEVPDGHCVALVFETKFQHAKNGPGGETVILVLGKDSVHWEPAGYVFESAASAAPPLQAGLNKARRADPEQPEDAGATDYVVGSGATEKLHDFTLVPQLEGPIKTVAFHWLGLLDERNYRNGYNQLDPDIRGKFSEEDWQKGLEEWREPLGKCLSRKFSQAPAVVFGSGINNRAFVSFETNFENKAGVLERVDFLRGKDGVWRLAGYRFQPLSTVLKQDESQALIFVAGQQPSQPEAPGAFAAPSLQTGLDKQVEPPAETTPLGKTTP